MVFSGVANTRSYALSIPPLPYKVCLFKGYNKVINAAVDFSAKRRKTTRRKTPKKREAQFFFFFD